MTNIIEFNSVYKYFNKTKVIDGISFSVPEGSVYGFLGNNGAGKSTTVKLLLGQLKSKQG